MKLTGSSTGIGPIEGGQGDQATDRSPHQQWDAPPEQEEPEAKASEVHAPVFDRRPAQVTKGSRPSEGFNPHTGVRI
eukprot:1905638-Heterocapsa_arctica.AAC.1